jgi:rubrerythrin
MTLKKIGRNKMPNFSNPLTGINVDHKLTKDELARAIRFMVAAEYEAIEMYEKVRDATDNEDAKKVIQSITDEELVHAGEFLKLLNIINPNESDFYSKGEKEISELLEKGKKAFKLTRELDKIATEIEPENKLIAQFIDNLSDHIESIPY